MNDDTAGAEGKDLAEEVRRLNVLIAELIRSQRSWGLSLRQGLLMGLGGAIGATVLVSLLIWLLQPLKKLEVFKPTLDRIARELEHKPSK
jgi:hypothetical protein